MIKRVCLSLALVGAVALGGCQASKGGAGGTGAVAVEIDPGFSGYALEKVAILDFANTANNPDSQLLVRLATGELMRGDKYRFTSISSFARDAERSQVGDDFEQMLTGWKKRRVLDKAVLQRVLAATGFDAVVVGEVTKWEKRKIDPQQEGTSDSRVGLRMEMWAADGTLLWSAGTLKVQESTPYNPDLHTKATASGQAVTDLGAVPEPPPIEPLAEIAAREVVATLPGPGELGAGGGTPAP